MLVIWVRHAVAPSKSSGRSSQPGNSAKVRGEHAWRKALTWLTCSQTPFTCLVSRGCGHFTAQCISRASLTKSSCIQRVSYDTPDRAQRVCSSSNSNACAMSCIVRGSASTSACVSERPRTGLTFQGSSQRPRYMSDRSSGVSGAASGLGTTSDGTCQPSSCRRLQ